MESRFSNAAIRAMAFTGAAAWVVLAVAWHVSSILEQDRDWEGIPQAMFFVGYIALLVGVLALGVMALNHGASVRRPRLRAGGLAVMAMGFVLVLIAGWAVPIWAAVFGVAMLVLMFSGARPRAGWIVGSALVAGSISWFALTALEVGRVDSYGDYPIAGISATWIAALGSAIGLVVWSKTLDADMAEEVVVV